MKKSFVRRVLYVIFAIASVIIIAGAVKTGVDSYKNKQTTPEPETAQVQVVDFAA
ncbi:MAG: hypothetical protein IJQ23_07960 [Clostridia bacterium]|nr:hypothetical protein [Clostridia bacterium]